MNQAWDHPMIVPMFLVGVMTHLGLVCASVEITKVITMMLVFVFVGVSVPVEDSKKVNHERAARVDSGGGGH